MTHRISDAIHSLGAEMLLYSDTVPDGYVFSGIIQPFETSNDTAHKSLSQPGLNDTRRYMLIAPCDLFNPKSLPQNAKIISCGEVYALLRCEPIRVGSSITHWECVLRHLGRVEYD